MASKQDSLRVLEEAGAPAPSYPTLNRRLLVWAEESWRQGLSEACAAHARRGPASLVLYDVSTLYFETDKADGFREPGFSKERRLDKPPSSGQIKRDQDDTQRWLAWAQPDGEVTSGPLPGPASSMAGMAAAGIRGRVRTRVKGCSACARKST